MMQIKNITKSYYHFNMYNCVCYKGILRNEAFKGKKRAVSK